jgi:ribonuclease E
VLDGARMRLARKPSALARELLRNFPKGRRRRGGRRRRRKGGGGDGGAPNKQQPKVGKAGNGSAEDERDAA